MNHELPALNRAEAEAIRKAIANGLDKSVPESTGDFETLLTELAKTETTSPKQPEMQAA